MKHIKIEYNDERENLATIVALVLSPLAAFDAILFTIQMFSSRTKGITIEIIIWCPFETYIIAE